MLLPGYEVCQEGSRDAWFCLSRSHWEEDGSPALLQPPGAEPKPKRLALGQTLSLPLTVCCVYTSQEPTSDEQVV